MELTYSLLNDVINKGVEVLKDVYPSFQYKGFVKVRIGKSRTTWGFVKRVNKDAYELTISNCVEDILDEQKAKNKLLSTVVHELIHTIPGCMNHGKLFKEYAARVNSKYPFLSIQRCTSMASYGVQKPVKKYSYIAKCSICNREWKYVRKPRIYNYISLCKCPYCKTSTLFFTK